jgi:uncharacterized membrane protein
MSGFVALATGLHMIWNWPLPGSYNIAIGDLSVLFGIVFLGTALALAMSWRLDYLMQNYPQETEAGRSIENTSAWSIHQ